MRGTPASSQIIWLEDKVKEQADEIKRLRESLERMLLEFDFLVEGGYLPDIRNDMIFDAARKALGEK